MTRYFGSDKVPSFTSGSDLIGDMLFVPLIPNYPNIDAFMWFYDIKSLVAIQITVEKLSMHRNHIKFEDHYYQWLKRLPKDSQVKVLWIVEDQSVDIDIKKESKKLYEEHVVTFNDAKSLSILAKFIPHPPYADLFLNF